MCIKSPGVSQAPVFEGFAKAPEASRGFIKFSLYGGLANPSKYLEALHKTSLYRGFQNLLYVGLCKDPSVQGLHITYVQIPISEGVVDNPHAILLCHNWRVTI